MDQNPWAVESIQAFYFLKCPECDFNTKEENLFENHASENHPLSLVLFDKKSVKKDFYFLKCPECDFDTKEENSFENHATENHPLSFVLFDKKYVEGDFDTIDIKEEPLSHSDTQISYNDQKSSTNNHCSQLSSVTEDNAMLDVPELKKEPTDESYMDENQSRNNEIDLNNSEMETYSTDVAIIGNNLQEDPLNSDVHEENSSVLFGKKPINEDFDSIYIKEEPLSHSDTQISYNDQKSSTHNQCSQLSSVTEDNSMLDVPELKKEPTDDKQQSVKKDFDAIKIKEEPFSHFDTQISHTDENSLTNNQFSPSYYINEDTSMLVVQDLKKEPADIDENDFNNTGYLRAKYTK